MDYQKPASNIVLAPLESFTNPGSRTFIIYLVTSFIIALVVHLKQNRALKEPTGTLEGIFPNKVYTHTSAKVDYIYFILNSILYAVILAPFVGLGLFVSRHLYTTLDTVFDPTILTTLSPLWATLLFSIVIALLADFGTFIAHYWMHRSPVLWEFHKVHHSAEVLTPLTVYRMHPLDDILTMCVIGVLTGTADALARFFVSPSISFYSVYGIGIASYLFFLTGYNLRHSHIWLSYGPLLSAIFISPAQHQIHHSKAKRHWNKNYGFIFAIWDYLFGSLYIPKEQEAIEFGIGDGQDHLYGNPLKLYTLPFQRAFALVRKKARRRK
jgi:sterol desaturase/sphingolipid hydroxylase (fatty acid hydroxylase superfamily)